MRFGPHLLGDIPGCDPDLMTNEAFVRRFMTELVDVIGMTPIGPPHLDLYTGPHEAWKGYSATVHIQTSHITAHFFAFGYVFLDIFSCRSFDQTTAARYVEQMLGGKGSWQSLDRGFGFPVELVEEDWDAR